MTATREQFDMQRIFELEAPLKAKSSSVTLALCQNTLRDHPVYSDRKALYYAAPKAGSARLRA